VGLIDCVAYSTGFKFSLVVRTKMEMDARAMGFSGPPWVEPRSDRQFQFGVRFSDGREAKSSLWVHPGRNQTFQAIREGREPELPAGPVISPRGGGGGGRRWDFSYWVWPLPPGGPVTISCEWPELWSGSVTADIDGMAIRRAGESSVKLWP
jgi:hypothetical protein